MYILFTFFAGGGGGARTCTHRITLHLFRP